MFTDECKEKYSTLSERQRRRMGYNPNKFPTRARKLKRRIGFHYIEGGVG